MEGEEQVSIIIPIYNAEKYLRRCVQSVLNSTYQKLEVLLVDDGSTDSSASICEDYAKCDKRVQVLHKKNEGAEMARAAGVAKASGAFMMFVDADDRINVKIIEQAMEALKRNDADIVCFDYLKNGQRGFAIDKEESLDKKAAVKNMLVRKKLDGNLWCKIYKTNLIKAPNVKILNKRSCDFLTVGMILENAERICILPKCGYEYSVIEGSCSHNNVCHPREEEYVWGAEAYHRTIRRMYPDLVSASEYNLLMALLYVEIKMQKDGEVNKRSARYKRIHNKFKSMIGCYMRNSYISNRDKLQAILIYCGFFPVLWKAYYCLKKKM